MSEPKIIEPPTIYDLPNIYGTAGGGGSSSSGCIFWTRFSNFDTNTLIDTPIIGNTYKLKQTENALYSIVSTTTKFTVGNINLLKTENSNHDNTIIFGYIPLPTPTDGNFSVSYICTVLDMGEAQFLNRLEFFDSNDVKKFEMQVNWHRDAYGDHWEFWIYENFAYTMYNYTTFDENNFGYNQFAYPPAQVSQNVPHVIRADYVNGDVTIYVDGVVSLVINNVPRPHSMRLRPDPRNNVTVGISNAIVVNLP